MNCNGALEWGASGAIGFGRWVAPVANIDALREFDVPINRFCQDCGINAGLSALLRFGPVSARIYARKRWEDLPVRLCGASKDNDTSLRCQSGFFVDRIGDESILV